MDENRDDRLSISTEWSQEFIEHLFQERRNSKRAWQEELRVQARARRAEAAGGASSALERAVVLLEGAGNTWQSVTGVLHAWSDERVLHGDEDWEDDEEPGVKEWSYRFAATSSPWRLRLDHFHPPMRRLDEDGSTLQLFIFDSAQRLWWEVGDGKVHSGGTTPDHRITDIHRRIWARYGDTVIRDSEDWSIDPGLHHDLDIVLRPMSLSPALDFLSAVDTMVSGRPAIRLAAVPGPDEEEILFGTPLIEALGDGYEIAVDAEFGIVLEVTVSVEGVICDRRTLSDLEFNGAVPGNLFDPSAV